MEIKLTKNITCSKELKGEAECSNIIVDKIQTPNLKLRAENENDTVHGFVGIKHIQGAHEILIVIYETDELPNTRHSSTLKRPIPMPTRQAIEELV